MKESAPEEENREGETLKCCAIWKTGKDGIENVT